MLIRGQNVIPDPTSPYTGRVALSTTIAYEVYGPFGQGYNVRTTSPRGTATLSYHWRDGPGAAVDAPSGKYEMSDESAYDSRGSRCIQLDGNAVNTALEDEVLLALFVVNHYFARKTGPFKKRD